MSYVAIQVEAARLSMLDEASIREPTVAPSSLGFN